MTRCMFNVNMRWFVSLTAEEKESVAPNPKNGWHVSCQTYIPSRFRIFVNAASYVDFISGRVASCASS